MSNKEKKRIMVRVNVLGYEDDATLKTAGTSMNQKTSDVQKQKTSQCLDLSENKKKVNPTNPCSTHSEKSGRSQQVMMDNDDEIDFTNDIPVFLKPALQKANKLKDIKSNNKPSAERNEHMSRSKLDTVAVNKEYDINDTEESFKFVKSKRQKQISSSVAEFYGKHGAECIIKDHLEEALHHLTVAIEADTTDLRHYINRGFCYLRLKEYSLAMLDAQYVMKNSDDILTLAKAKYQASVAAREFQNLEAAERYLLDCINLTPRLSLYMELLRVRLTQLTNLGFPEDVSLDALQKCSNTTEAITLLTERTTTNDSNMTMQNGIKRHFDRNEIYHADDEEISTSWLLLNLAKSQFKKQHSEVLQPEPISTTVPSNVTVKKAPIPKQIKDGKKPNKVTNDYAVWVGNITSKMSRSMLQEHFSKFGQVTSVHITNSGNLNYAFVNYKHSKSVARALAEGTLQVNGVSLIIHQAEIRTPAS